MMNARAPANLADIEIDVATIRAAHERIRQHILRTPVLSSPALDEAVGAQLFFKCENLQRVSAFKARVACNAVLSLSAAEAKRESSPTRPVTMALRWPGRRGRGHPGVDRDAVNAAQVKRDAVRVSAERSASSEPTVAARGRRAPRSKRKPARR
jgi:threonine dehydratase